jgi:inosine-uridine nucleoside N-ribohydrolase
VLELAGRGDIPVAAGADRPLVRERFVAAYVHGETGMDGPALEDPRATPVGQHAAEFLAERVAGTTLVPTGPLTNVALMLALHPGARPDRIVLMGGAYGIGNVTPAAEFNIWADPEAARRVFESGIEVTMIGLDVTHKALMTRAHAEMLRGAGKVGRFVAELHDFFSGFHARTYGSPDSPIHDAVAVAHVLRDDLVETSFVPVEVDCSWGLGRGRTNADLYGRTGKEPTTHVGVDIDADGFFELLLPRLASLV